MPTRGGLDGDRLPDTPKFTAAFSGDYGFQVAGREAFVGTTVRHVTDRVTSYDASPGVPQYELPDYTLVNPNGCNNVATCFGMSGTQVRTQSANQGAVQANLIRGDDVLLYTIGLGNPAAAAGLQPDTVYLKQLANVDGMTNPSQPRGKMYFAPSSTQLEAVFQEVARDLIVRLAG